MSRTVFFASEFRGHLAPASSIAAISALVRSAVVILR